MKSRIDRRSSRTYPGFNRLIKLVLGAYLRLRFNLHGRNRELFRRLRPPYLILATHVGYWDPFMISVLLRDSVHWVAADQTFRNPLQGYLLQFVGAIPKTKGVSDFETIRKILQVRRRGGVVGLFPEGQRTWDGSTLPLLSATAKLVKLLRVPVVIARFEGHYFAHPRWARRPRLGKVLVSFRKAFSAEELRALAPSQIHERLQSLMEHDDYQFQASRMIPYRSRRPAEYIENVLFFCPECRAEDSIRSRRRDFFCRSCGARWHYSPEGFLSTPEGRPGHRTIREWNRWQLAELRRELQAAVDGESQSPIFETAGIKVATGFRSARIRPLAAGTMRLYRDRLVFEAGRPASEGSRSFPLSEIDGINIQLVRKLELYHQETLYTFDPISPRVNMYKCYMALEILSEIRGLDIDAPEDGV